MRAERRDIIQLVWTSVCGCYRRRRRSYSVLSIVSSFKKHFSRVEGPPLANPLYHRPTHSSSGCNLLKRRLLGGEAREAATLHISGQLTHGLLTNWNSRAAVDGGGGISERCQKRGAFAFGREDLPNARGPSRTASSSRVNRPLLMAFSTNAFWSGVNWTSMF